MTTEEKVRDELRDFLVTAFDIGDDEEFDDDVHLFEYGYVDSFGAVRIIDFIQERFGVRISDEDLILHPLNTVREIGSLVAGRVGGS